MSSLVERLRTRGIRTPTKLEAANEIERLREALTFYAEQWEQDVDAELTANGWQGSIGEVQPTYALREDSGHKAREALSLHKADRHDD